MPPHGARNDNGSPRIDLENSGNIAPGSTDPSVNLSY